MGGGSADLMYREVAARIIRGESGAIFLIFIVVRWVCRRDARLGRRNFARRTAGRKSRDIDAASLGCLKQLGDGFVEGLRIGGVKVMDAGAGRIPEGSYCSCRRRGEPVEEGIQHGESEAFVKGGVDGEGGLAVEGAELGIRDEAGELDLTVAGFADAALIDIREVGIGGPPARGGPTWAPSSMTGGRALVLRNQSMRKGPFLRGSRVETTRMIFLERVTNSPEA